MKVIGLIPARLESNRLPNKAILDICGLPMIIHTMKRSEMAKTLDEVYVATDSSKIAKLVEEHGGKVIMTSSKHKTGSDRIAEAARNLDADIIVNIQGDEALVDPAYIEKGVQGLINSDAQVSILLTPYSKKNSPSDIKAVVNLKNEIMYFSRTDIPSDARVNVEQVLKGYHIISFRKEFLLKYTLLEQTPLEKVEFNEFLRILENGHKIQGVMVESDAVSVDTQDDLDFVRKVMEKDKLRLSYTPAL
jgi:3-deoxy-manno-octulosonate cytidylyltransferase (CMP-KDO synthetase)